MVRMDASSNASPPAADRAGVTVRLAARKDLPEVLRVQRAGFRRVAARFGLTESELPPMRETLDDLETLRAAGVRTFIAVARDARAERVVGTVRATLRDDGAVEVGRLAVDDGFERRGVASTLMAALETAHPDARRFELFTSAEADDALALYSGLGYRVFCREDHGDWSMVWLAKDAAGATAADGTPLH
jgi:ribosomal protein S18 acetylase RimI-like enzyme